MDLTIEHCELGSMMFFMVVFFFFFVFQIFFWYWTIDDFFQNVNKIHQIYASKNFPISFAERGRNLLNFFIGLCTHHFSCAETMPSNTKWQLVTTLVRKAKLNLWPTASKHVVQKMHSLMDDKWACRKGFLFQFCLSKFWQIFFLK